MSVNYKAALDLGWALGKPSPLPWETVLQITPNMSEACKITRATLMACGQFNYWEVDGKVVWSGVASEYWTEVILGKRDIDTMNLVDTRKRILKQTEDFLSEFNDTSLVTAVGDLNWWSALSHVFGGDPLRKRETLLWIMLDHLGIDAPVPERGCIDYNLIVALRRHNVVTGYETNQFSLYEETCLRVDCLRAIEHILDHCVDKFSMHR